jgi:type II secretory pathway pseudopilin PulG
MKFYLLQQMNKLKQNNAFSIFELTVVLAIIAITTTLVLSLSINNNEHLIIAEAHLLRSTIWHLQQRCRAENKNLALVFNEQENFYTTPNEKHKLSARVKFGTIQDALGPPSSPKKRLKKSITFKNKQIKISPHGIAQAGTVYLVDDKKQLLYAITVPISGVTFIRMYRYRNKQWHVYT